jgi:hypothetical protein
MLALAAVLFAAPLPVTQQGPYLEMQAGPQVLFHDSARRIGPEVRLNVGLGFNDRFAVEAWLSGALLDAPLSTPGDQSRIGAGLAGRARLLQLDSDGKLGLWGRVGAGYAYADPTGSGPTAFGGAQLLWQPFVRRFAVGLEMDALAVRSGLGFAVLPSLRCAL